MCEFAKKSRKSKIEYKRKNMGMLSRFAESSRRHKSVKLQGRMRGEAANTNVNITFPFHYCRCEIRIAGRAMNGKKKNNKKRERSTIK